MAALVLALGLAGCRGPQALPAGAAPGAPVDPRVAQLEAENRALRAELESLRRENQELQDVVDRIRSLEMEIEMKRRRAR